MLENECEYAPNYPVNLAHSPEESTEVVSKFIAFVSEPIDMRAHLLADEKTPLGDPFESIDVYADAVDDKHYATMHFMKSETGKFSLRLRLHENPKQDEKIGHVVSYADYEISEGKVVCRESEEQSHGIVRDYTANGHRYVENYNVNYATHTPRTIEEIIRLQSGKSVRLARGRPLVTTPVTLSNFTFTTHHAEQEVGSLEIGMLNSLFLKKPISVPIGTSRAQRMTPTG